jgi:hypothetical protein
MGHFMKTIFAYRYDVKFFQFQFKNSMVHFMKKMDGIFFCSDLLWK